MRLIHLRDFRDLDLLEFISSFNELVNYTDLLEEMELKGVP